MDTTKEKPSQIENKEALFMGLIKDYILFNFYSDAPSNQLGENAEEIFSKIQKVFGNKFDLSQIENLTTELAHEKTKISKLGELDIYDLIDEIHNYKYNFEKISNSIDEIPASEEGGNIQKKMEIYYLNGCKYNIFVNKINPLLQGVDIQNILTFTIEEANNVQNAFNKKMIDINDIPISSGILESLASIKTQFNKYTLLYYFPFLYQIYDNEINEDAKKKILQDFFEAIYIQVLRNPRIGSGHVTPIIEILESILKLPEIGSSMIYEKALDISYLDYCNVPDKDRIVNSQNLQLKGCNICATFNFAKQEGKTIGKYILAFNENGEVQFVFDNTLSEHKDIVNKYKIDTQKYLVGGGWIVVSEAEHSIELSAGAVSGGFGYEPRFLTEEILEKAFPDYNITIHL